MGFFHFFLLIVYLSLGYSQLINDNSPVFYCFVNPPVKTQLSPSLLSNITGCSHLVYGRIPIDRDSGYPEYSISDVDSGYDMDNMRTFLRMRAQHPNAKFLIGVVRNRPFDDEPTARRAAEGLRKHVKSKRLDGIFISFNGIHLEYKSSATFIETLSSDKKSLSVTFGVTGRRVFAFEAVKRLREINEHVDHIYLDMGELPSNEDPRQITQINPLFANTSIPFEETIEGTVEELSTEGILPHRIIIGLTAGGWKFEIPDSQDPLYISHGQFAEKPGQRVTYQEACKARGAVIYDRNMMNEITVYRQTWMSVNLPTVKAMGEKMKWILNQKFAGLGISDALSDDPEGVCGTDPLPAHRLAMTIFQTTIPSNPAECTRLCYLDPSETDPSFPIDNLRSDYCSHMVIRYFDLDLTDTVLVVEGAEELVKRVDEWRGKILKGAEPKLILSIGSLQSTGIWQFLLGNDFRRKELAESIVKMTGRSDGIEVSWTLETMASEFDKKNLKAFIDDVIGADLERKVEIVVATTFESAYKDFYDYPHLNRTASLIVLHTHRLHSDISPFTGHPSPLHPIPSMKNPKMSWVEALKHWTDRRIPRSKLILSLSASTLSMQSLTELRKSEEAFGQPVLVSMLRSKKTGVHSQQEICESIDSGSATAPEWVEGANVPFLKRMGQMVAYENPRSAHIKAIWASMEGVGGVALHSIQNDDPHAICDNRTAFPLLKALTRAQTCHRCIGRHDFRKCSGSQEFVVSCRFDLKRDSPIFKTDVIPYERCTEVVVDHATLTLGGNVNFTNSQEEGVLKNLTSLRPEMLKCGMVLSLSCGTGDKADMHLNYILGDNMTAAVDNVMRMMDEYKFSGLQLDCEKAVRRGNHIFFNTFLRKIYQNFENTKASNGCNRTLSARLSHFTKSPSAFYSISLLNKLSHISIRMTDSDRIDLPFFQNLTDPAYPSTEKFLEVWRAAGLKPEKLVVEVSPFGFEKEEKSKKKVRMSQGKRCQSVGKRAVFEPDYEKLMARVQHKNGTVWMPMEQDSRYKIGYIRREQLGGISLNSVNGDDYMGICGKGSFPMLKSIYSGTKCR